MRAIGVICGKQEIQYTCVDVGGAVVEEEAVAAPASRKVRGDQLGWLLDEAEALLQRLGPAVVYVKKAGSGQFASAPERHEVEGLIQLAAFRLGIECGMRTTEQVRASHVAKGKGAYEGLLMLPDVAARSNKDKRERYLYAITAIKDSSG